MLPVAVPLGRIGPSLPKPTRALSPGMAPLLVQPCPRNVSHLGLTPQRGEQWPRAAKQQPWCNLETLLSRSHAQLQALPPRLSSLQGYNFLTEQQMLTSTPGGD